MYRVTIQTLSGNENTIYYAGNEDYTLAKAVLDLKVGSAGEFEFTIPITHPRYNEIDRNSIITVYEDANEIWRGDIREISQNFDKSLDVYCLEDLAWLGDETVTMTAITNQTYLQRFTNALATYNADRTAKRQFTQGVLTSVTTTNMCNWKPEWEMTLLDCLRKFIADDGYLKIRRVTSGGIVTRYLDIVRLEDYGNQSSQTIQFGSNLLDFVKDIDTTNFLNVLYPYGAETETPLYGDQMERLVGTPIQNEDSIAAFGRRARTVTFDTESLATLNRLALAYLNRYSQPKMTIEVKAVDLGNIEVVNRLHIGDSVRIIAQPFGIDQWEYITKQSIDLLSLANNSIQLCSTVQIRTSLTSQIANQAEMIEEQQSASSILNEAKANALRILNGENGGVIYFINNTDNQIIEQRILNNPDIDQATKAWRWNLNGLAFMKRTYPSDEWDIGVAITMNGEIVADYITTGSMYADRIHGGTLTLGGAGNQNGVLVIKNASGQQIGKWDKDGITATKGTFSGALSGATGTFSGSLSAASGTFKGSLSAATGTFSGQLAAATGTLTDGYYGILSLAGGNLYMNSRNYGGAGVFAEKYGSNYYSCWGAVNSAARNDYSYLEVPTMDVIQAGNNASDERLKEQIEDIDDDFATKLILGIHPKQFKYKETEHSNGSDELNFGVIAQEILAIEKECGIDEKNRLCYKRDMDGMYAVEYRQLIAPLIKVVQDQQEQIDKLQAQVNELVKIIKEERNG